MWPFKSDSSFGIYIEKYVLKEKINVITEPLLWFLLLWWNIAIALINGFWYMNELA